MHLWLLRHGDALHPPGIGDAARPLSPLGKKQSRRVGTFLQRQSSVPQRIITSPFTRAVQTSRTIATICHGIHIEESDTLLSGASSEGLFRLLNARKETRLLLVGHEPLMSAFTSLLIAGHSATFIRFSPCTLAMVQYGERARPDGGTLHLLVTPDSLLRSRPSISEKRP